MWLEHIEPNLKPRTIHDYRYSVERYIIPTLGRQMLSELKPLHIQALVNEVAKNSGARTANLCRMRLLSALKQAIRWDLIRHFPVDVVQSVKETKREQIIWNPEEAIRFLAAARPHRLYALFYVAMATGLRHGELLQLRWEDLEGAILWVRKSKTAKGVRRVSLSPDVVEAFEEHRQRQNGEKAQLGDSWVDPGLVFASAIGTTLNRRNVTRLRHNLIAAAKKKWQKEAQDLGNEEALKRLEAGDLMRRATLHDLRHLNVSIRRKMGQDAKLIADQIGHADPALTMRLYTHLFEEDRLAAGVNLKTALGSSTGLKERN